AFYQLFTGSYVLEKCQNTPKDEVSDMAERILHVVPSHPIVKNIILHIGTNDVVKQQSEILKRDFTDPLNIVSSLNVEVFISGPLPPVRGGAVRFSRSLALNTWLSTACTSIFPALPMSSLCQGQETRGIKTRGRYNRTWKKCSHLCPHLK
uniref:SGNH hydrolase-type esterase domain-containing protein n=1 Tax=Seriola dumerili TaxID=41447 RepID=A0A3B4VIK0_SERDU